MVKTQGMVVEAKEEMEDLVAEVRAQQTGSAAGLDDAEKESPTAPIVTT